MCAISGAANIRGDKTAVAAVEAMNRAQQHRGHDDTGIFANEDVVLGHSRLSIIDLEHGHQPLVNSNGTLALIVNGEIYNFKELRSELETRGHTFQTNSDSEVILHLYEEYSEDFVNYLDGMFAFALYDLPKRRLLLGRDRLGQKPLLYFMDGDTLVFASAAACLHTPDFRINWTKMRSVIFFRCNMSLPPTPRSAMYANCFPDICSATI